MSQAQHHHNHELLGGRAFGVAVAINVFLTVVEVAVGIYAGSTALIADALHNLNDAAALVIAWWARRMAARKADQRFTYGYGRAELVAAVINLTALVILALSLAGEAVMRFFEPIQVHGGAVAVASLVALMVDLGTAMLLWKLSKGSLNLKAAFLHNLSDAGFSLAVLIGGVIVLKTNQSWIDPTLTLALAGLMIVPSISLLRKATRILMLGSPPELDPKALRETLLGIDGVSDVHHLHVWQIDESTSSVEAHLSIEDTTSGLMTRIVNDARSRLQDVHQISHGTFQLEPKDSSCETSDCASK